MTHRGRLIALAGAALVLAANITAAQTPQRGGVARLAQAGRHNRATVSVGGRDRDPLRLSRDRGGVDGDRAGPPAVGDLGRLEDG